MKVVGSGGTLVHTYRGEPVGTFTLRPARVHHADGPSAKRRTEASATRRDQPIFTESSCSAKSSSYTRDRLTPSTSAASRTVSSNFSIRSSPALVLMPRLATLSARGANKAPTC